MLDKAGVQKIMQIFRAEVAKFISYQHKEDAVPNPPGYDEAVRKYARARLKMDMASFDEEKPTDETDGFDYDRENLNEIGQILKELHHIVIEATEEETDEGENGERQTAEFPFKTEFGPLLEGSFNRLMDESAEFDLHPPADIKLRLQILFSLVDCQRDLQRAFPHLKIPDLGSKEYELGDSHYFLALLLLSMHYSAARLAPPWSIRLVNFGLRYLWLYTKWRLRQLGRWIIRR